MSINSCATSENTIRNSTMRSQLEFDHIIKIPPMSWPIWNGNIKIWTSFFDTFYLLVHFDAGLTDVQNLYYLCSCVVNTTSDVIQSTLSMDDNYIVEIELRSRYKNQNPDYAIIYKSFVKSIQSQ